MSKRSLLLVLLVFGTLCGCSGKDGEAPAGAAAFQGEKSKAEAFLAYEHNVSIKLEQGKVGERLTATREACTSGRFGACDLLGLEQNGGAYQGGSLTLRMVPDGIEQMVAFAADGGSLQSRQTRAEDLAQAVADNRQLSERLQRQHATLLQYQARKDLSVSDMLALARELAEVEVQLAANQQQANQQQRRIATNLLTLDFSSDYQRPGRLTRIGDAASELLDNATDGAAQALQMFGYSLPFLIILFPLALLARWLWRKTTRRDRNAA